MKLVSFYGFWRKRNGFSDRSSIIKNNFLNVDAIESIDEVEGRVRLYFNNDEYFQTNLSLVDFQYIHKNLFEDEEGI